MNPQRIESNVDVFDFELTERDVASIPAPEDGSRLDPDLKTFDFTG